MNVQTVLVIQIVLFLALVYVLYKISKRDGATIMDKSLVTILSILILGLSDKFKLLFWGVAVSVIYLIKLLISKKRETNGKSA